MTLIRKATALWRSIVIKWQTRKIRKEIDALIIKNTKTK